MITSGRIAHLARRATDYGVWNVPSQNLEQGHKVYHSQAEGGWEKIHQVVDMQKVRQRKRDIVNNFRNGSESKVANLENLEVIRGDASFKDANSLTVKMTEDGEEIVVQAETFFVNVGERPSRPKLPGLDSLDPSRVLDSTSIMELGEVPHHLIVLGGGYIGMEFGQLFRRLGSRVTVIQKAKRLVPREDPEIASAVQEIMTDEGMTILLNTEVANMKPDPEGKFERKIIVFHTNEKGRDVSYPFATLSVFFVQNQYLTSSQVAINGSHLLLATGRVPNTDTLNLEAAGVQTDARGSIKVNSKLQTNVPSIYALGDVHGGPAFTHISFDDFRILRANFVDPSSSVPQTTEGRQVPYVMYIDPQLGHVGLHEHEAREKFPEAKIQTASMPMSYVARGLETDETRGLMKAVVNADSGQILGFTCLGVEGGEIMSLVQTAMMGNMKYTMLQNAVYAHPTWAESLNNIWNYLE